MKGRRINRCEPTIDAGVAGVGWSWLSWRDVVYISLLNTQTVMIEWNRADV